MGIRRTSSIIDEKMANKIAIESVNSFANIQNKDNNTDLQQNSKTERIYDELDSKLSYPLEMKKNENEFRLWTKQVMLRMEEVGETGDFDNGMIFEERLTGMQLLASSLKKQITLNN